MNELNAHIEKLDAKEKSLSEDLEAQDDALLQLEIEDANKAVQAMTQGAFKTIKPQLVPSLIFRISVNTLERNFHYKCRLCMCLHVSCSHPQT